MAPSMRVYLLFLSLLCSVLTCSAELTTDTVGNPKSVRRYSYEISMEKGHITGIMITKCDDGAIIGTLVNEFGVSALSFVYDAKKHRMQLKDVMSMLDKWYIKRVLKADLTFCLHILYDIPYTKKNNYILSVKEPEISITNPKRKLTYTFKPLDTDI